jgi:aspartyl/glutamyl-tRNA(Asn/Gln) amidotransferase C subunit
MSPSHDADAGRPGPTALDPRAVLAVAKLARLDLDAAGATREAAALLRVLEHFSVLDALDLAAAPAETPAGIATLRPDVARPAAERDALVAAAPRGSDDLFVVPRVIE